MHIQTHLMSGWCAADLFELNPRERFLAMVAASAADVDGIGVFVSWELYTEYHHVVAHNALFGTTLAAVLGAFARNRLKGFIMFLALFHLHLVLDYYGSGPGWGVSYLWPFSTEQLLCPHAWELSSWQNFVAGSLLLAWTVLIAIRKRRTPLEFIAPSLNQKMVTAFRKTA